MPAQVKELKSDYTLAIEKVDAPVYGGLEKRHQKEAIESKSIQENDTFASYVKNRAVHHLKDSNLKNARALIEIGDMHFNKRAFNRSIQPYIKALKVDPDNIPVYEKLIQALTVQNRVADADRFFNSLLERVSRHPKYLSSYIAFRMAVFPEDEKELKITRDIIHSSSKVRDDRLLNVAGLFEMVIDRDFSKAESIFKQALRLNSENVDANNNLAICYKFNEDYVHAERYFNKAHFLDLQYVAAYENLASTYYLQGKNDKAIAILENAQENHVELSMNWRHNLAMFYFVSTNFMKAIEKYEELQKKEPTNSLIVNNLGVCHQKIGAHKLAESYFKKAVGIVRENKKAGIVFDQRACTAFNNLIQVYIDQLRYASAKSLIKNAQKLFPYNNVSYHQEGIIALRLGEYSNAKALFERSMSLNPRYFDSVINLSYLLEDFEFEYQPAIDILLKYIHTEEGGIHPLVFNNLAYAYLKLGNVAEAEKYIINDDKSFASLATKGFLFLLKGDENRSENMYQQAFEVVDGFRLELTKQFYYLEHAQYYLDNQNPKRALEFAKSGSELNANPRAKQRLHEIIQNIKKQGV